MILYLHGFLSSPASAKAQRLRAALADLGRAADFLCPPLPVSPRAAAALVLATAQLEDPERLCLVGSSLGGYYATWAAEQLACRAVLLNPAIRPYEHPSVIAGSEVDVPGAGRIEIRPEYIDELRALETGGVRRADRYLLVAATGDDVFDYREMLAKYADCEARVIEGSDHALSDFDRYVPDVVRFCIDQP